MTSIDQAKRPQQTPLERGEWVAIGLAGIPAAAGVLLSFGGMSEAARPWFDPEWNAYLIPIAVDGAIFAGAVGWIMSLRAGRRGTPWRLVAHLGVALTVFLNALASPAMSPLVIGLHVGGPIIWSVFVEIIAHHIGKRRQAELGDEPDRIPWRLWVVAPGESFRTSLRMARTGERSAVLARIDADRCTAAVAALRITLPNWRDRKLRRIITRRLATGSLPAAHVLEAVGWVDPETGRDETERVDLAAEVVVRRALRSVLEFVPPERDETSRDVGRVETNDRNESGRDDSGTGETERLLVGSGRRDETSGVRVAGPDGSSGGRASGSGGARREPRPSDVERLRTLVESGDLTVPVTEKQVLDALAPIGAKYARLAQRAINNGHHLARN